MAFASTQGVWIPTIVPSALSFTNATIDATGEKFAMIGRVWNKDRTSKDIRKVGFRFGTVTKAGGSALTVSLQNVDTANGPPYRPDGSQDETVAISNADGSFASNTYIMTGNLSADRTVAFGELLAVVIEFDGSGRLGSDSVGISHMTFGNNSSVGGTSALTASWAAFGQTPIAVLEFSDGTFGKLDFSFPTTAIGSSSFNSGTTSGAGGDEQALKFSVPFTCKIDGVWIHLRGATGADFDVVLYQGTTALQTVSIDQNTLQTTNANVAIIPIPETTLLPNVDYYVALKPTTTNNVSLEYFDVAASGHLQAHDGGTAFHYAGRADGGSWTAITTRRPFVGIRISALDDGVQTVPPTFAMGI